MAMRLLDTASLLELMRTVNLSRFVAIFNVVLVIWVAYAAAAMTWRFVTGESTSAAQPPAAPVAAAVQQPGNEAVHDSIARLHLFGNSKAPAPVRKKREKVPETSLKLSLRGVISSDEPSGAYAIIAGPKGGEQGYGIGDILPGNAKLVEIYPERIVLLHKGRKEVLSLEAGPDQRTGRARKNRNTRTMRDKRKIRRDPKVGELLKQYREDLQNNPSNLLKVVRPIPVRRAGKFIGFRLGLGRDRNALAQFDLEPGDIVTAINGVSMDNPTKGINALRDLKSADMLDLQVERKGQKFTRSFQMP